MSTDGRAAVTAERPDVGQIEQQLAAMERSVAPRPPGWAWALIVVGLSAERAAKEIQIRDDMMRVAHRAGASLRQLAEVAGLGRKTVTAIIERDPAT